MSADTEDFSHLSDEQLIKHLETCRVFADHYDDLMDSQGYHSYNNAVLRAEKELRRRRS